MVILKLKVDLGIFFSNPPYNTTMILCIISLSFFHGEMPLEMYLKTTSEDINS